MAKKKVAKKKPTVKTAAKKKTVKKLSRFDLRRKKEHWDKEEKKAINELRRASHFLGTDRVYQLLNEWYPTNPD